MIKRLKERYLARVMNFKVVTQEYKMNLHSEICHICKERTVVRVSAHINNINVGSALAEAITVEEAEDKATRRLITRIKEREVNVDLTQKSKAESNLDTKNINTNQKNPSAKVLLNTSVNILETHKDSNNDPEDWSEELGKIDIELKRLKWGKEEESKYLQNTLGINHRNKILDYNKLLTYLKNLKSINNDNSTNDKDSKTIMLYERSDKLIKELGWDAKRCKEVLFKNHGVKSRMVLELKDLEIFTKHLEEELNTQFIRNNQTEVL